LAWPNLGVTQRAPPTCFTRLVWWAFKSSRGPISSLSDLQCHLARLYQIFNVTSRCEGGGTDICPIIVKVGAVSMVASSRCLDCPYRVHRLDISGSRGAPGVHLVVAGFAMGAGKHLSLPFLLGILMGWLAGGRGHVGHARNRPQAGRGWSHVTA
jgi:hypothetical protein